MTADEIKKGWEDLNEGPDTDGPVDQCARFLLAAADIGTRSRYRLAALAGLDVMTVYRLISRGKRVGVIRQGKIVHSGWFHEETGGIAFIMDAMTLAGLVERVRP